MIAALIACALAAQVGTDAPPLLDGSPAAPAATPAAAPPPGTPPPPPSDPSDDADEDDDDDDPAGQPSSPPRGPENRRPLPRAVLLPLAGLGVDGDTTRTIDSALMSALARRFTIVDGAALTDRERERLETCARLSCAEPLARSNANAVISGTVTPVGGALAVVMHLKTIDGDARVQTAPQTDLAALGAAAAAALPIVVPSEQPSSTKTPKTPPKAKSPTTPGPDGATGVDHFTALPDQRFPPAIMLLVSYGLSLVPLAGSPLVLPLVQGFVFQGYGKDIAGVEYQNWWVATMAGYATYAIGLGGGIALYTAGLFATFNQPQLGVPLILGGALLILAGFAFEPVVFYGVAHLNAVPASPDDEDRPTKPF